MAIISQETFDKFTEEEKQKIRDYYNDESRYVGLSEQYVIQILFGKENLQPEPEIKIWEDVMNSLSETEKDDIQGLFGDICCGPFMNHGSNLVCRKMIATLEISKLIELGYGGMITDEEWEDISITKYVIEPTSNNNKKFIIIAKAGTYHNFISFHTLQQAEKFMSYPENVGLVKQYYMI